MQDGLNQTMRVKVIMVVANITKRILQELINDLKIQLSHSGHTPGSLYKIPTKGTKEYPTTYENEPLLSTQAIHKC